MVASRVREAGTGAIRAGAGPEVASASLPSPPRARKGIEVGKAQELSPDPVAPAVATSPTSRHVIKTFLFCSFVLFEFLSHATTGILTNTSLY